jgi:hypothetical protein
MDHSICFFHSLANLTPTKLLPKALFAVFLPTHQESKQTISAILPYKRHNRGREEKRREFGKQMEEIFHEAITEDGPSIPTHDLLSFDTDIQRETTLSDCFNCSLSISSPATNPSVLLPTCFWPFQSLSRDFLRCNLQAAIKAKDRDDVSIAGLNPKGDTRRSFKREDLEHTNAQIL